MKTIIICFLLLQSAIQLIAQEDTVTVSPSIIERYIESSTGNDNNFNLNDLVEDLKSNPIDLNEASAEDLIVIPFLSASDAKKIIGYRNEFGKFFSVSELNSIENLDPETIENIKPFVRVSLIGELKSDLTFPDNLINFDELTFQYRSRIQTNLQTSAGYLSGKYPGSKLKVYNRLNLSLSDFLSAGLLVEKDPGELSYTDFYSGYLEYKSNGLRIITGDYLVEFGQGLALWSPYAFTKGSDAVMTVIRKNIGMKPNRSANENQFFRGISGKIISGNFEFGGFYSGNRIDANIDSAKKLVITTPVTGLHRTEYEITTKRQLINRVFGINMNYGVRDKFSLALLHFRSTFDFNIETEHSFDTERDKFDFTSLSYQFFLQGLRIGGEFSYNHLSVASINNIEFTPLKSLKLAASIRNYPVNYFNLYANGFSEKSGTRNEIGFYMGLKWRTDLGEINLYFDQFKFPSETFGNPMPSKGNDLLLEFMTTKIPRTTLLLRYQQKYGEIYENNRIFGATLQRIKRRLRFDFHLKISDLIKLRNRLEFTFVEYDIIKENEVGYLFFQDAAYSRADLRVHLRLIFFKSDSYDSRVYQYENDLTGIISNPPLFGEGIRWYFLVKYKPFRILQLSIKYAETFKPRETFLHSGNDLISNNLENTFSFQVDLLIK